MSLFETPATPDPPLIRHLLAPKALGTGFPGSGACGANGPGTRWTVLPSLVTCPDCQAKATKTGGHITGEPYEGDHSTCPCTKLVYKRDIESKVKS